MNFILFDGQHHVKLKPLTLTRPVSEIRVGIFTIKEKWEFFIGDTVQVRCKDYLQSEYPSNNDLGEIGISAALCPNDSIYEAIKDLDDQTILMKDGVVLAIHPLPIEGNQLESTLESYQIVEYNDNIHLIDSPKDIFLLNGEELESDLKWIKTEEIKRNEYGEGNLILGDQTYIEEGAMINGVTLNSQEGPIYIANNVEIMEGSNIRGPFAILNNSTLKMGAKIYGPTTIGPYCKVGGEVSNSVFQGYANKAHDGFVGNSVIGHWCNLGADTNTSNLKNNYGIVKTWRYSTNEYESTGTQYCGLVMGDHSKSGINTMFNTGTVVGTFANIFDCGFPAKFIPCFSWGGKDGFDLNQFDKAIEVAKVVMQRRGVELNNDLIEIYQKLYEQVKD